MEDVEDTSCYNITVVWSCNAALWFEAMDIYLLVDEWKICCQTEIHQTDALLSCTASFSIHRRRLASVAAPLQPPVMDQRQNQTVCHSLWNPKAETH